MDILIVAAYFAVILAIGSFLCLKRKAKEKRSDKFSTSDEFFLAGKSMHWIPVGLSIMVTAFSGINYTAFSGEVFANGLYVALSLPVFIFVAFPVIRIIMPLFHHMGISSAYEYLEKRFDRRVRLLASFLFMLWRTFWMATALYVPSKVLAVITGFDLYLLILITGVVVTFYSAGGGMRAVMWTDVVQFGFLVGGLFIILVLAGFQSPEGYRGILSNAAQGGLFKPFFPFDPALFSPDPTIRITLLSSWIGTFTAFIARYGADQMVVQRYFTARSLNAAKTGFHLSYAAAILALVCLAFLGFAMYDHAARLSLSGTLGTNPLPYLVSFFKALPPGATGLLVAGLLAATMSSMDSCINSCCAAVVIDFFPSRTDLSTRLTVLFGSAATLMAMTVGHLGSIFEIANKIINGLGAPLLALFLMALFSRTATAPSILIGGILGTLWSIFVSFFIQNLALHYYAVVNLLGTLIFCHAAKWVTNGRPGEDQLKWTWKEIKFQILKKNSLKKVIGYETSE